MPKLPRQRRPLAAVLMCATKVNNNYYHYEKVKTRHIRNNSITKPLHFSGINPQLRCIGMGNQRGAQKISCGFQIQFSLLWNNTAHIYLVI
ncbi:hypothetical protein [Dickeya fangzhongdai]|uniref:hypothetical protein n=1 Tax=Dickeya fangzhongdai TaxID=1778540 RepID=UPI002B25D956|nr:hypothetical protein [Dickeya fangzhongdai]WOY03530.1 hypothetical protein OGM21_16930 [Dickeya fangzhongdai]